MLFLFIIATFSTVLQGMENDQIVEYSNYCRTVKGVFERDKNDFCAMVYKKHLDPVQELARVEQQFMYHKNKLIEERNANLLVLKNSHNISDTAWGEIMKSLEQIKVEVKSHINTVLPHAQHDDIISGENKLFFAKHLKKYDLDLEKICVKKRYAIGDELLSFMYITEDEIDNSLKVNVKVPEIAFSVEFGKYTSMQQKAELSKIAWIIGNVGPINSALIYFVERHSNKKCDFDTVQHSAIFQNFVKIEQYKMATLFSCFEDYETCQCIEAFNTTCLAPALTLDQNEERFQGICVLKSLWEKRKALQEFVQK
jgi:hypothetical protein